MTDASAPPAPSPASSGSHRLWAFLLILDSAFVIVFAGAVAAKVYQYWKAPAAPLVAARRRPVKEAPKPEPAPAPEPPKAETAKAEPPKPEPVKAEPAKPESKPLVESPRPPKPSLLSDGPKHRETPGLAGASSPAKPAPASSAAPAPVIGSRKAVPVEFKLRAPKAQSVGLIGAFIVRGGRKDMSRQSDGTWQVTLYLHPGQYRYFFSVDKKKQLDPENPRVDRGASLLEVP